MTNNQASLEITAIPALERLVDEVARTGQPARLRRDQTDVALVVPLRRARRQDRAAPLLDTSTLSSVPHRTIAELVAGRPPPPASRPVSWDEIKAVIAEERAERWREKSS